MGKSEWMGRGGKGGWLVKEKNREEAPPLGPEKGIEGRGTGKVQLRRTLGGGSWTGSGGREVANRDLQGQGRELGAKGGVITRKREGGRGTFDLERKGKEPPKR